MMLARLPRMLSTAAWLITVVGMSAFSALAASVNVETTAGAMDGERFERGYAVAGGGQWSVRGEGLVFIDSSGRPSTDIALAKRGYGTALHAAVDPYDNSIWIGTDARLVLHFSVHGTLLGGTTLPGSVEAIAVALDKTCWIVSDGAISHLSESAAVLESFATSLRPGDGVTSLAVDSLRDQLWLANTRGVWRIPLDRAREATTADVTGAHSIALDPLTGELWLLTDDELVSVDHHGNRQQKLPVPTELSIEAAVLDYDAVNRVVIIRTNTQGLSFSREAGIAKAMPTVGGSIVMAPPLAIMPTVKLIRPPSGAATLDTKPELTLQVDALCNGERCAPPSEYVDGIELDAQIDGEAALRHDFSAAVNVVITPATVLAAGSHRIAAHVTDRFARKASLDATISILDRATSQQSTAESPASAIDSSPERAQVAKAANKAPTVVMTSPASGTTFTAGATVALTATATDADGSIAKVEFYRNGSTLIGTATSSPYQFSWANVAVGTYSLTAKAYDNRNGIATSAAVSITVLANKPPVVTLTQPAAGAFYGEGAPISLAATASDADGTVVRVEFVDGSNVVGVSPAPPFDVTWSGAAPGNHVIVARAIDDKGAMTISAPLSVSVGRAPLVVVKGPLACSIVDGGVPLVVTADAVSTDGSIISVEFLDNGIVAGVAFSEPWTIAIPNPTIGSHELVARATDDRALVAQSRPVTLTVGAANQPPHVTISAPAEGSHFANGSAVSLAAVATDADGIVTSVEYRLNDGAGVLAAQSNNPPFAASWANPAAGSYALVAVAIDDHGAKATSSAVHITIDANVPPVVSITAPGPNRVYVAPATVALSATATDADGTVARVDFFAGATQVGSASAPPFAATWNSVAVGSYLLTARATDNRGATSTSATVPIVVTTNAPPTVTLNAIANEQYFAPATVALGADASDTDGSIARVEFRANGALIGTATTAPYSYSWGGVATGAYSITATGYDDRGAATISTPATVVVGGSLAVAMDSELSGATIGDDNVLIRGVVSAPSNSAMSINGVVAHIDDFGRFQANDIALAPGANTVTAIVTTQDGQTAAHTLVVNSTGRGTLVAHASPTEGLNSLTVTFNVENPDNAPFDRITFDLDNNGTVDVSAVAAQFVNGALTVSATYPAGTWLAVITAYDDRGQVIYITRKSIVVFSPTALQTKLRGIYDGMLGRLRTGNVNGALTALTSSARERYGPALTQLQTTLPSIVSQLGELQEVNFGIDLAELSIVRTTASGTEQFMLYMLRSEDGIWRFDGM